MKTIHKQVIIIGGGPGGLAAAAELKKSGIDGILILEREHWLGGILRQCIHDGFGLTRFGETLSGPEYAQRFIDQAEALGIEKRYWNRLQKGETVEVDGAVYTPDMVMGQARKGLKVTYCTDTRPTEGIVRNARDADLFICEGMYGEPEKKEKAKENKHMTFLEAAEMARRAGVKRLWLTHYSPSVVRPEDFMGGVRRIFPGAIAAKDGRTEDLKFEEDESET